jgi:hypothetical protein
MLGSILKHVALQFRSKKCTSYNIQAHVLFSHTLNLNLVYVRFRLKYVTLFIFLIITV